LSSFLSSRRVAAAALLTTVMMAGCSGNSVAPTSSVAGANDAIAGQSKSPSQYRALSNGQIVHGTVSPALSRGWMSPDAATNKNVIYWGNYDSSTINIYASKGVNGKLLGQITTGLSDPERLFVDKNGSVYASNIGNNTITAYKAGATSPFLTISTGVDAPTGLTVDAAGTVYVANVGSNTITEYPKGKTSPSVTVNLSGSPEYLATDSKDNLYASVDVGVVKIKKGKTSGTDLNLSIGSAGALEVDSKGNLIVLDSSNDNADYFPAGKKSPSKQIPLGGFPFGFSLSKNEKTLYVSNSEGSQFEIQSLAYPNGKAPKVKLSPSSNGQWPIAISPDTVLGS
jgi:sugar lactone lactonase YvrE